MSGYKQQLKQQQKQALNLTPQLEKRLQILQYNEQELQLAVSEMLANNIMLTASTDDLAANNYEPSIETQSANEVGRIDRTIPSQIDADVEWKEIYSTEADIPNQNQSYILDENRLSDESSFDEAIENAIYMAFSDPKKLKLAQIILQHLDEQYFLTQSPEKIAQAYQLAVGELNLVLETIKHLEPAGVGSQSIKECMLAQLHSLSDCNDAVVNAHEILSNYFDYIGQKPQLIKKRLNLSDDDYQSALSVIQALSPYPDKRKAVAASMLINPDIYIHERMGIYYASLNKDARFDIYINEGYAKLAKSCQGDDKHFITGQLQDAKSFISALEQREKTILRVANVITLHQQDYFQSGDTAMKPLLMQTVAEQLQLNESTISRAVNGKYLSFNEQLIPLRIFFSQSIAANSSSDAANSAHAIKAKIKTIIGNEDKKKPLSDAAIEILLKKEAIDISRRTIAKYREQLGIVKTSQRKIKN